MIQLGVGLAQLVNLFGKLAALRSRERVGSINSVGSVHSRENRLQTVIVFLRDRIKFVVVATCTLNGDAAKGIERVGNHVVAIQIASYFSVDLGFRDLYMADEIPGARSDKTQT